MHLTILTPEKELFDGEVTSVKVPGISGQFEILRNHAPIVAALGEGDIRVINALGEKQFYSIKKGFVEVLRNEVSLLVQVVS
ncbi:MAG: ATP synthase F1 subunit epsilon [Saprospiraceae bacterium]|jgi:F-type H+-transporting ATPase subunit epsilon|nr:ATP synthase F1 subunit epsilon [Saprospiraceae bacterium]